jgi:hypothetical protein
VVWAGAIEFSTTDIILILVAFTAIFLAVPAACGIGWWLRYKRRTPEPEQTRRKGVYAFVAGAFIGMAGQLGLLTLYGLITSLLGW